MGERGGRKAKEGEKDKKERCPGRRDAQPFSGNPPGPAQKKKEIHARGKTSKGEKHLLFSSAPGEDEQYVDTRRCLSQGFYGAFDKRG